MCTLLFKHFTLTIVYFLLPPINPAFDFSYTITDCKLIVNENNQIIKVSVICV